MRALIFLHSQNYFSTVPWNWQSPSGQILVIKTVLFTAFSFSKSQNNLHATYFKITILGRLQACFAYLTFMRHKIALYSFTKANVLRYCDEREDKRLPCERTGASPTYLRGHKNILTKNKTTMCSWQKTRLYIFSDEWKKRWSPCQSRALEHENFIVSHWPQMGVLFFLLLVMISSSFFSSG